MKLLKLVQSAAIKILEEDPGLEEQKNIRLKNQQSTIYQNDIS